MKLVGHEEPQQGALVSVFWCSDQRIAPGTPGPNTNPKNQPQDQPGVQQKLQTPPPPPAAVGPLADQAQGTDLMFQKGTKVPGSEAEGQPH